MKKYLSLLCLVYLFAISSVLSQADVTSLGFSYSALVRDTAGRAQPLKAVKMKFTLLLGQNGTAANSPWIETQNITTDAFGFVNVVIGNGTKAGGTATAFANVDFALANYWVLIEVFNTVSQAYDPLSKQAFQSVPYAKVAGALSGGSAMPSGAIVAFGGDESKVPAGWLPCDGRQLDNTDPQYQALFNAIGYGWGTDNHTTYFRVPQTRGLFLRGAALGSGNDPDRYDRIATASGGNTGDYVGTFQYDGLKKHKHDIDYTDTYYSERLSGASLGSYWGSGDTDKDNNLLTISRSAITKDNWGGYLISETRSKNVAVNYIIKL